MLWSIDSSQNRVSADQNHLTVLRAQVSTHWGRVFLIVRRQVTSFQRITGSSSVFFFWCIGYRKFRSIKILITNWPQTLKFSQLLRAGKAVANVFNVFGTGQSSVRPKTSMTTCCVVNANIGLMGSGQSILHDKIWIFLSSNGVLIARERCLELSNWMSVY